MSKYNEYTKGGGLNPFYVEEECHQHDLDQFISDSKYIASHLGSDNDDSIEKILDDMYDEIEKEILEEYEIHEDTYYDNLCKKHCYKEFGRLEGQMAFLNAYSGDAEKLRLAKLLLGIKE